MLTTTTLRTLDLDEALALVDEGAAFVDLRPTETYLEAHIPGSLGLLYEAGPGMAGRARDCIPLDQELILLEDDRAHMGNAAAALRGKGFSVLGGLPDGLRAWSSARGTPASTEVHTGETRPEGTLLHVGDPGAEPVPEALRIPVERLWRRADEVPHNRPVVVLSGYGVRAALAVGILERSGREAQVWLRRRGG